VFEPESGKVLREARLKDGIGEYYAQPVAGDGKICFVSEEGKVSVIKAGADWEMLSSGEVEGSVIATPAIADSRIYLAYRRKPVLLPGAPGHLIGRVTWRTPGRFSSATMHRSPGCHPCHPYI
jgi:hypothetical protein